MTYLKPKQHYIDLYDRFTVERCRRDEAAMKDYKKPLEYDGKELKGKQKQNFLATVSEVGLYFIKGERYMQKEETIREWMNRDEEKDRLLESAQPPENIRCLTCRSVMHVAFKDLHDWGRDEEPRVLFMYDCPQGHMPRRAFFSDGEEWRHESRCPQCQSTLENTQEHNGNMLITTEHCSSCGYTNTDEMDLSPKKEDVDKNFAKDRERFCLSDEEGQKFRDLHFQMHQMADFMKDWKEKEKHKDEYDKVAKLKKLTVIELEELLTPEFEKAGYTRLQFGAPEMDKDLFIPFTAYDTKSDRRDRDSSLALQRIAKTALEPTNWRLMSDGISYRSGILTGRFRAYEREEDLLKLVK